MPLAEPERANCNDTCGYLAFREDRSDLVFKTPKSLDFLPASAPPPLSTPSPRLRISLIADARLGIRF
jgi:hypothetical protein